MRIIVEANPKEIAALVEAIQERPEIREIERKGFQNLTTEDFAKLNGALCTTVTVETSTEIQVEDPDGRF